MHVKVVVKHSDNLVNAELRAVAQSVLAEFPRIPGLRLLCFLDDEDAPFFRMTFGGMNRGQFVVLEGTRTIEWPDYITEHIYSESQNILFDHVIYLYGATCADPVGRVMTFAHELQHFVQYGLSRRLWAESRLFWGLLPTYEIPTEREARAVAKSVAEKLCGSERVEQYIAQKIEQSSQRIHGGSVPDPEGTQNWQNEIDDWRFIERLHGPAPCDLAAITNEAFRRLGARREELEKKLQDLKARTEFEEVDLSRYYRA